MIPVDVIYDIVGWLGQGELANTSRLARDWRDPSRKALYKVLRLRNGSTLQKFANGLIRHIRAADNFPSGLHLQDIVQRVYLAPPAGARGDQTIQIFATIVPLLRNLHTLGIAFGEANTYTMGDVIGSYLGYVVGPKLKRLHITVGSLNN
jgi:hypothetical protein